MSPDLIENLCYKFPTIFRSPNGVGFSCGDGWYWLIYDLSAKLEKIALSQRAPKKQSWLQSWTFDFLSRVDPLFKNVPGFILDWCMPDIEDERLVVLQIKEKFGGLRYYVSNTNSEVNNLITEAEDKSFSICETCGSPGTSRRIRGWLTTLCDKDYSFKLTNAFGSSAKN